MLSHHGLPPKNRPTSVGNVWHRQRLDGSLFLAQGVSNPIRASGEQAMLERRFPRVVGAVTRQGLTSFWISTVAVFAAMLSSGALPARETTLSPEALREIAQVEAEIDRIEAQALERLAARPDNHVQQIELLGKLMLYD